MKIIISPAKTMNSDDAFIKTTKPVFLKEAMSLVNTLKTLDYKELKNIWNCSDKIAKLNYERIKNMDLTSNVTPAIMSYEGIQYKYIATNVFNNVEYDYLQKHLIILSGLYGLLRPFDGVVPYRLEMKSKLKYKDKTNLYDFWGEKLAKELFNETDCIVNLASQEYSICIKKYLSDDINLVSCKFAEKIDDKLKVKATLAKMARGKMVRFMAENKVRKISELKEFSELGFSFQEEYSKDNSLVFVKK